jgi:hypothetical protein
MSSIIFFRGWYMAEHVRLDSYNWVKLKMIQMVWNQSKVKSKMFVMVTLDTRKNNGILRCGLWF